MPGGHHTASVSDSPVDRVRVHASERGADRAVLGTTEGSTASLTWAELRQRSVDGGAGMTTAGVRPGDVVLVLLSAGVRAVEVELAVRAIGAVPVHLPDDLDPAAVPALVEPLPVRLVVVDEPRRLALLRLAGLDVPVLECDDVQWGRLRAVGAHQLLEHPRLITLATAAVTPAVTAPVVAVERDKSAPWLVRPAGDGASDELRPGDVVLLVGAPSDRLATVVRRAHAVSGCTLAWIPDVEDLAATLSVVRPTHLFLDKAASRSLPDVLVEARIAGEPWHPTPADVLDAAAAQAGEARLRGRTRKLAGAVADLAPWFGGRLRHLVVDSRVDRLVLGLAAGLDLHIGRVAHHPARQAAFAAAPTAVLGGVLDPAVGGAAPVAQPAGIQQSLAQRAAARLQAAREQAAREQAAREQAEQQAAQQTAQEGAGQGGSEDAAGPRLPSRGGGPAGPPAAGGPTGTGLPTRSRGGRDSAFSLAGTEE